MAQEKAVSIDFEEFTEAATAAVLRAVDKRTIGSKEPFPGTVTVGIIWDPDRKPPSGEPIIEKSRGKTLTKNDLRALSTGRAIDKEAVGKITDMLQRDYRRLGVKFANSLEQDFGGTMDQLFELSPTEREAVYDISAERPEALEMMSRLLLDVFENSDDLQFSLDIISSPPETVASAKKAKAEKKGIDWEINIETKCETDKNIHCSVSLTIEF